MSFLESFISQIGDILSHAIGKILFAIVLYIVGRLLISGLMKLLDKAPKFKNSDGTVQSFAKSFLKIVLYCLLAVAIIGTLGVEMSSIAAVLASCGVCVGLALQGALSNLAGGIMLMIFRPFKKGDFIEAAGVSGVVQELTTFYTVLLTLDNKRVTVPNGSLMNSTITDYSSEQYRRVDLSFSCAKSEKPSDVCDVIQNAIKDCALALTVPEAPFVNVCGGTNEAIEFTVRVWCNSADYWTVYFDLNQKITEAIGAAGVKAPAVRIISDK